MPFRRNPWACIDERFPAWYGFPLPEILKCGAAAPFLKKEGAAAFLLSAVRKNLRPVQDFLHPMQIYLRPICFLGHPHAEASGRAAAVTGRMQVFSRCDVARKKAQPDGGTSAAPCGFLPCALRGVRMAYSADSGASSMRSRNWSRLGVMIICVRRLRCLPSSVSLDATGLYSPRPAAERRLGSTP